jgi:hypothetical protein
MVADRDRRRRDVGASFNLVSRYRPISLTSQFGYSFLLHLYSSPLTHHSPPPATLHGRPDVHALFHLWVGLTELVWLQAIELSPTLRRNQLLPTGVCGALGLVHFVYALATAPLRFPSFTFVTHLIALFLSIIIVITVFLRGLNSLLTVGYIPSPVWDTVLPQGSFPSPEDDAGVALLKLGTECIKATSYSGLRNELASVQLHPARPALKLSATGCDAIDLPPTSPAGGFATRIDDIGVTELTNPNDKSLYTEELANLRRALFSLVSDVFTYALVHTPVGRWVYRAAWRAYHARWWYGPRSWRIWRRAAWSAPRRHVARDPPALTAPLQQAPRLRRGIPIAYPHFPTEPRAPEYTYDQVLRGEVELPDDEDDGWESDSGASVGVSVAGSEWGEWEEEVEEDERGTLYTDLVEDGPEGEEGEGDSAAIMLAHLTTRGTLTRRRYAAMLAPSAPAQPTDTVDAFSSAVADRRAELLQTPPTHDEWDEERRRACVVCMVNARDVVLWPCRCLTMCDECRDGLADRLGPGEHTCPSCRTKVDGYSRIYVP